MDAPSSRDSLEYSMDMESLNPTTPKMGSFSAATDGSYPKPTPSREPGGILRQTLTIGDRILTSSDEPGQITSVGAAGYNVKFDGGDEREVPLAQARLQPRYSVDDRVEANYQNQGPMFPARISAVRPNGTYDIAYDDGDCETAVASTLLRAIKPPAPTPTTRRSSPSGLLSRAASGIRESDVNSKQKSEQNLRASASAVEGSIPREAVITDALRAAASQKTPHGPKSPRMGLVAAAAAAGGEPEGLKSLLAAPERIAQRPAIDPAITARERRRHTKQRSLPTSVASAKTQFHVPLAVRRALSASYDFGADPLAGPRAARSHPAATEKPDLGESTSSDDYFSTLAQSKKGVRQSVVHSETIRVQMDHDGRIWTFPRDGCLQDRYNHEWLTTFTVGMAVQVSFRKERLREEFERSPFVVWRNGLGELLGKVGTVLVSPGVGHRRFASDADEKECTGRMPEAFNKQRHSTMMMKELNYDWYHQLWPDGIRTAQPEEKDPDAQYSLPGPRGASKQSLEAMGRDYRKSLHQRDEDARKADYAARLDKKQCPFCGTKQEYDEMKEKKTKCQAEGCPGHYTIANNYESICRARREAGKRPCMDVVDAQEERKAALADAERELRIRQRCVAVPAYKLLAEEAIDAENPPAWRATKFWLHKTTGSRDGNLIQEYRDRAHGTLVYRAVLELPSDYESGTDIPFSVQTRDGMIEAWVPAGEIDDALMRYDGNVGAGVRVLEIECELRRSESDGGEIDDTTPTRSSIGGPYERSRGRPPFKPAGRVGSRRGSPRADVVVKYVTCHDGELAWQEFTDRYHSDLSARRDRKPAHKKVAAIL